MATLESKRRRQDNLIEYMINNPQLPETYCARDCGVPNSTYFDWKKNDPYFLEELNRRIKEKWADSERLATETMISLMKEKNFNATRYILDNLGYKPVDKIQADINNSITINICDEETGPQQEAEEVNE